MKRRHFIRGAGAGAVLLGLGDGRLFGAGKPDYASVLHSAPADDYPYPYDDQYFECSPRVIFLRPELASINLVPKRGRTVEGKLQVIVDGSGSSSGVPSFTESFSADDSLDIPFVMPGAPEFTYWLEYKTDGGNLSATPRVTVKTPVRNAGETIKIALYGDPHVFDDADRNVQDPFLRAAKVNGEHFKILLRELNKNPAWLPTGELRQLRQAFCFASGMTQILIIGFIVWHGKEINMRENF